MPNGYSSSTAPSAERRTYNSIQYLRAIAALMVVAWHAEGQVGMGGTRILQSGIEFFLIISGFVMWIVSEDARLKPGPFMARRLARIVPLYWVLTSMVAAVALLAPKFLQSIRLAPDHLMASYVFLPWPNPTLGVGLRPLLIPGWTLNYEVAFYTLVAVSLWAPRRWRAVVTLGALALAAAVGSFAPPQNPLLAFYLSPLVADFALGILLALTLGAMPASAMRWGAPIAALGLGGLFVGGAFIDAQASGRFFLFAVPAVMIVGGALMWEQNRSRAVFAPLKVLGDASFPLYLVHTLLLSALAQGWRHLGLASFGTTFVVVGVGLSCVVGVGLHFGLEKPLTDALQRRVKRWFARDAGAPSSSPKTTGITNKVNILP